MRQDRFAFVPIIVVALVAISAVQPPAARGGTDVITVTTTDDELNVDGDCSLREAVMAANTNVPVDACPAGAVGLDVIELEASTYTLSIPGADEDLGATGDLDILEPVQILADVRGPNAIIDGGGLDRIFDVSETVTAGRFSLLTLQNGSAGSDTGGAVRLRDACGAERGNMTMAGVVLQGNRAAAGGAVYVGACQDFELFGVSAVDNAADEAGGAVWTAGSFMFTQNSTFSGNRAGAAGGAIWADPDSVLSILFTTMARNSAPAAAALAAGRVNANYTIFADNAGPACDVEDMGGDSSTSDDPTCPTTLEAEHMKLMPLGTVGGFPVHQLSPSSPARDVDTLRCPDDLSFDQVGSPRPQDGDGDGVAACDAGASEAATVPLIPAPPALPDTAVSALADPRPPLSILVAAVIAALGWRRTRSSLGLRSDY